MRPCEVDESVGFREHGQRIGFELGADVVDAGDAAEVLALMRIVGGFEAGDDFDAVAS